MEPYAHYDQQVYKERPMPSMTEATKTCLKQYSTFSGRARRSEYWWFFLAQYLIGIAITIVWVVSFIAQMAIWIKNGSINDHSPFDVFLTNPGFWLYAVYCLALIIPNLAVNVRRLHDIGRSGWFLLLFCLCPVLLFGAAFLIAYYDHDLWFLMIFAYLASIFLSVLYIVWMATNGKKETNKWGPSPKYYQDQPQNIQSEPQREQQ